MYRVVKQNFIKFLLLKLYKKYRNVLSYKKTVIKTIKKTPIKKICEKS